MWLADDLVLDQRVAIKVIPRERGADVLERTRREVRAGRQMEHGHLIRVFDLVDTPTHLLIVMEWLPGGSVKDRLRSGPLRVEEAVTIAEQTLQVLAYLHRHGVVHRDVKPSNLLLGNNGSVKLADLGLVRNLADAQDLTRTGTTVGTPDYMSPEQLRGNPPAPPADLYGLGVTLYELLSGERPFSGQSEFDVADGHLHSAAPSLRDQRPDCPRWLAAFVRRLLEKRPADRWRDAGAALAALSRRRIASRRRWRHLAWAALALAVVVPAVWLVTTGRPPTLAGAKVIDNHTVAGVAPDGHELWRRQLAGRVQRTLVADVTGDEAPEAVLAVQQEHQVNGILGAALVVLSARGKELVRVDPGTQGLAQHFPKLSRRYWAGPLATADLDGDGRPELLWISKHRDWYPSAAGVWWGHGDGRSMTLLVNSGRLDTVQAADLDDDGRPEVIVTGVNNPIGYQTVVAVLSPRAPAAFSPDMLPSKSQPPAFLAYAPLGPEIVPSMVEAASSQGIVVREADARFRLGRWGSPLGSPLQGHRQVRNRFWADLRDLCRSILATTGHQAELWREFSSAHSAVLQEPASFLAAILMTSRALAAAGDHRAAIQTLARATDREPQMGDLWLRLGEQRLIIGQRRLGRAALLRSLEGSTPGRIPFDNVLYLTLDAALHDDDAAWDQAMQLWDANVNRWERTNESALAPLRPFYRGQWTDAAFDRFKPNWNLKATTVMAEWALLERGKDPLQVAARAEELARDPEVADPAHLLEAAAQLRAGNVSQARATAREALNSVRIGAATSYESFVWLPVAEWLMGSVLQADNNPAAARPHLETAARNAPEAWFGQRAAQALHEPGSSPAGRQDRNTEPRSSSRTD